MLKALQLVFTPEKAWEKIALANRGVAATTLLYLLPLMVLALLTEGYALTRWGEIRGVFDHLYIVPRELAIRYAATHMVLGLVLVFWAAKIIQSVAHSFDVPASYALCFTATAYGASPIFLMRFLDAFPALNTWVCWSIGALGCVRLLYHGIGTVLKPPQSKGLGLYLIGVIVLVLMSGMAHFLAVIVLEGRFKF